MMMMMSSPAAPTLSLAHYVYIPQSPTPNLLFLSPLSSSSPLTFSLSSTKLLSFSSRYSHFVSYNTQKQDDDDEEENETVIGDCLVFEDGVFEDPILEQELNNPNISSSSSIPIQPQQTKKTPRPKGPEIEPQNLIPDEWGQVVEQLNLTKKERRKIAQDMEFGQRLEKKKRLRNVNLEDYFRFRDEKLAQLKPLLLDNPTQFAQGNSKDDVEENANSVHNNHERVEPRNPRWAVYGRGLDDISEFFNSGNYQPTTTDAKSQGRQKLFTKEEKALMNSRFPKLAIATSRKWVPLHTLAASGEFYLVDALRKHNADINAADQDGLTALHKAITCKKQAVTNYLLRESANPFVRDKDGASLLHYAVRTASSEAIKTLLFYNVDINLQDNDGWTPLHLAVQSRRTDVVRLLLIKGADKTLKNRDGLTPLELCLYSGRDAKSHGLIKILKQLPRQRVDRV